MNLSYSGNIWYLFGYAASIFVFLMEIQYNREKMLGLEGFL